VSQVKALFYIPIKDNDGRDLAGEIADLQSELYQRFAGWTSQGYVKGAYRLADGTPSMDVSESYLVLLDEARLPELEQILRDFRAKTLQEAIYLEIQREVDVRFI
jgi:hypothetical protein